MSIDAPIPSARSNKSLCLYPWPIGYDYEGCVDRNSNVPNATI